MVMCREFLQASVLPANRPALILAMGAAQTSLVLELLVVTGGRLVVCLLALCSLELMKMPIRHHNLKGLMLAAKPSCWQIHRTHD